MKAIHKLMARIDNQWVETDVKKLAYLAGMKEGELENQLSKMYEGQTGTTSNGYQFQLQSVEFVETDLEAKLRIQKENARERFRNLMKEKGTPEHLEKLRLKELEWAEEEKMQQTLQAEKELVQEQSHLQVTGNERDSHMQDKSHIKKELDRLRAEIARLKGEEIAEPENAESEDAEEKEENLTIGEIETLQEERFLLSQMELQNKIDAITNDILRSYGIAVEGDAE